MDTTRKLTLACLAALAVACASDADPESLGAYAVEMQVAIDAMHAELTAHHEAMHVRGLAEHERLEWRHMDELAAAMDRLERAHQGITMCGQHMVRMNVHSGMVPLMAQNDAMTDLIGEAHRELDRHQQAVDLAGTMEAAFAEEAEHVRIMDELLDRMRSHCEGMTIAIDDMGETGTAGCPSYTRVPRR